MTILLVVLLVWGRVVCLLTTCSYNIYISYLNKDVFELLRENKGLRGNKSSAESHEANKNSICSQFVIQLLLNAEYPLVFEEGCSGAEPHHVTDHSQVNQRLGCATQNAHFTHKSAQEREFTR